MLGIPLSAAGRTIIEQSYLRRYSTIWITECGIMLWKWGRRRHQHKSRTWVASKYWHTERSRNWVFFTERNRLKLFSDTKIVRHTSLKLDKNPYLDSEYFKLRKLRQKALKLTDWCKMRWDKLKDSLCA